MTPAEYRDMCKGFNALECHRAQIYAWGVACMIPVKNTGKMRKNIKAMMDQAKSFFGLEDKKKGRGTVVNLGAMTQGQIEDRAAEAVANLKAKRKR